MLVHSKKADLTKNQENHFDPVCSFIFIFWCFGEIFLSQTISKRKNRKYSKISYLE